MPTNVKDRIRWPGVPPWLLIGALLILFPIFAVMTFETISRQKESSVRLLREKGAALIRAFEAGTRSGMIGDQWSGAHLQRLLAETAQLPDIAYILVTDSTGRIVAHDDPLKVGEFRGDGLDFEAIARGAEAEWRIVEAPDGAKAFEVFRKFQPTGRSGPLHRGRMMQRRLHSPPEIRESAPPPPETAIFVGLDMTSVEEARRADTRHTLILGTTLLLVCSLGVFLLFLTHGYRGARVSLSRIKAFSDNLVENMPIGLIALDPEKKIASMNNFAGAVLRLSPGNVIGSDAKTALPAEIAEQVEGLIVRGRMLEKEIEFEAPDGTPIPLELSGSKLDATGKFLGHLLLFKDLSEVKSLRSEIARTQRLAEVGRLAAGVAHEIRNPLSSLKGFATYFKERYRRVPEDQQIADIMIQEVDRLNRVVGQLLEFARPVALVKRKVSAAASIEGTLQTIALQAGAKKISIERRLSPDAEIDVDPDRMNQVLLNIFLNALEAMEEGGGLTVALERKAGDKIEIVVLDTGAGIGREHLAHVFDPFFTTKATGTGLGLAIARNIVEAHGGEIRIDGPPGGGTRVRIILPLKPEVDPA